MAHRVAQYGFSGGVLSPQLLGRTDLEKYQLSLKAAKNCLITRYGGVQNRPGTEFIGEVRDSADTTCIRPFQFSTTQAYILEFGDEVVRPIKDDGQVLETAKNVVSITKANPGVVEITGHSWSDGDLVFPDSIGGMTELEDGRVFTITSAATDTFVLVDLWGNEVDTTNYTTYTSGGTFSRLYQLTSPYDQTDVFELDYAQTADTMYLTHLSYAPRRLTRTAHSAWSFTTISWGPTTSAPSTIAASVGSGSGATAYIYKIATYDEDTGEESLPSTAATVSNDLTVAGYFNDVTWSTVSGAERYIIYKEDGGAFGYIGGVAHPGTSFSDDNILPDLGDAPQGSRDPFTASSDYPAKCDFHGGRLALGQTTTEPGGVWLSQATRYENLNVSTPAKADDAVSFVLAPGVNAVRGFASVGKLLVLTAQAEFTADGGGVQKAISPASLDVRRHSARGSADNLKPIVIGDIALFVQRQGGKVIAYGYSFEKDGYRGNDLTLLAPHFFRGHSIVDWCYQQDPDSIVWCVRDDGVLLALTFIEEQNTFAWTDCYLGGTFGSGASATGYGVVESCACIEGPDQDDVYLVVKRTINSVTKRYIEKLVKRWDGDSQAISLAEFLDSHINFTATSDSTTAVPGLWHLEGQSVYALAAGSVQGPFTVASGAITLSTAIDTDDVATIGLGYEAHVVDLPIAGQTETGAPQGKTKVVKDVVLKLQHSRGVRIMSYEAQDRYVTLSDRDVDEWADVSVPYSGDTLPIVIDGARWDMNGSVMVTQPNSSPLPFEILMIARNILVDGK